MSQTRRRMRRVQHEEVGLQIAPMIDVTLLLLFFFMLSGKLTKGAKLLEINIPTAASQRDAPRVQARAPRRCTREWYLRNDTP